MTWMLVITLCATIGGNDCSKLYGTRPFTSLEECRAEGKVIVNWLTQDFIVSRWYCIQS